MAKKKTTKKRSTKKVAKKRSTKKIAKKATKKIAKKATKKKRVKKSNPPRRGAKKVSSGFVWKCEGPVKRGCAGGSRQVGKAKRSNLSVSGDLRARADKLLGRKK